MAINGNAVEACLVWEAFAQFGVGEGAVGTATGNNAVSITDSFAVPTSCP